MSARRSATSVAAMPRLSDVPVRSLPTERFGDVLDPAGYAALLAVRERADRLLGGSAVWCVNSTAHGGGVAEMLRSLLAYARGAGIDARWSVLNGDPAFFAHHEAPAQPAPRRGRRRRPARRGRARPLRGRHGGRRRGAAGAAGAG